MTKFFIGFICGALSVAAIIVVSIFAASKISVTKIEEDFSENNEEG